MSLRTIAAVAILSIAAVACDAEPEASRVQQLQLDEQCPEPEKCIVKACFDPRTQDKIDCAECDPALGCFVDGNFDALCLCESVNPDEGQVPCVLCEMSLGLYTCLPPE